MWQWFELLDIRYPGVTMLILVKVGLGYELDGKANLYGCPLWTSAADIRWSAGRSVGVFVFYGLWLLPRRCFRTRTVGKPIARSLGPVSCRPNDQVSTRWLGESNRTWRGCEGDGAGVSCTSGISCKAASKVVPGGTFSIFFFLP